MWRYSDPDPPNIRDDTVSSLQDLLILRELNIILTTDQLSRQLSLAARIENRINCVIMTQLASGYASQLYKDA